MSPPAGRCEYRSGSVQPQCQRAPVTSRSGPILDLQQGSGSNGVIQRLSNSQLSFNTSSIASAFSQVLCAWSPAKEISHMCHNINVIDQ